ncbi:cytochrome C nitrite reductase [Candidatus Magnetominusculus xianensis]|uniref:nitrite reductase (cytochrome; ammonia-forming) n=2 Tax=Candidatus Magnetominusculus xianensis TaxID=1748249 RepID=A0ABR5SD46_9BACT|nr:cytochrome C nitrite reductase [Candidatus Magnetominusculus xianensis]
MFMRTMMYCTMFVWIALSMTGCSGEPKSVASAIIIPDGEKDPAVWGRKFPNHYDSYLKNSEKTKDYSKYKSDNQCRLSPWPFQFVLFDGWGFGVEYNEPNGHTEMMKDQRDIDSSRKKAGGVCLTCKTPYAPELRKKLDIDYFRKPYDEVLNEIPEKHRTMGLVCIDCHDPATMDLRISRQTLIESLKAIGKDPEKLTRQEKRSLVCAQCHVDYSIPKDKDGKSIALVFPWKNGKWGNITIEAVIKQIRDEGLKEWKHKPTDQKLGHLRHPEFELFSSPGSVHWAAGVACADCHMPYERVGREKISSHRWESPLKNDMKACMQCHTQDAKWLKDQVYNIQDRVNHMFTKAGYTLASAALTLEAAVKIPKADNATIEKAKALYAEAYYRCTWIGAENSMGFHNPTESLRVLGDALDLGHQAEALAREAILKASATPPEFDMAQIDKIVAERSDGKTGFKADVKKRAALMSGK